LFNQIEDRYREVIYVKKLDDETALFRLTKFLDGSDRVILNIRDRMLGVPLRDINMVFLKRLTRANNWIAEYWPKEANPWLSNELMPEVGSRIFGRVQQYIEEFGVVLKVNHPHISEVIVDRKNLPKPYRNKNIQNVLFKGDVVAGKILPINYRSVRIDSGVDQLLRDVHRKWSRREPIHWLKERQVNPPKLPELRLSFKDKETINILVVDDDPLLCRLMNENLDSIGCKVTECHKDSPKGLLRHLYECLKTNPDFIILDYQTELEGDEELEVKATIKSFIERQPDCKCCVVSGNLENAMKFAFENNYGYFAKPLNLTDLIKWINNPEPVQKQDLDQALRVRASEFAVETRTEQIVKTTNELLNSICERLKILGSAWFIVSPKHGYELRANSSSLDKMVTKQVCRNLTYSVLEDSISSMKTIHGPLPESDPMMSLGLFSEVKKHTRIFYHVQPLIFPDQPSRCVVFFSDAPFTKIQRQRIEDRKDHFLLLIESINSSEELDEIASSAQQGRIALATLHELRREISNLSYLMSNKKRSPEEKIKFANEVLIPNAASLAKEKLGGFTVKRQGKIILSELCAEISMAMRLYLADMYPNVSIELQWRDDGLGDREVSFNPMPIERALINLIDNAAGFLANQPKHDYDMAKKIWVITSYENIAHSDKPIKITVIDTGPGVALPVKDHIFLPRRSTRGDMSMGMGLYLSKELLSAIGGSIELLERPRWMGAGFQISLPMRIG